MTGHRVCETDGNNGFKFWPTSGKCGAGYNNSESHLPVLGQHGNDLYNGFSDVSSL